ncbi:hypothetical protein J2X66_002418 [Pseudomonas sp. 3296]|nr:hypothetical protein [Pseudomonas sp. 3296]
MAWAGSKRKQANYILHADHSHALRGDHQLVMKCKKPRHQDRAFTCSLQLETNRCS